MGYFKTEADKIVDLWIETKHETPAENMLTKSLRMDKEFAEEEMERMQKENSDLKDEVEKLQKQLAEWQNANISLIKDSAICNTYTYIRWDELCRLREIADKYAEITGHKGVQND